MPVTSFDTSFDTSFQRANTSNSPTLPPVGGEGARVGYVEGAVLPFSTNALGLSKRTGQGWERWRGLPGAGPTEVLPFILSVPAPNNPATSPYCTEPVKIIDAETLILKIPLLSMKFKVMLNAKNLFVISSGGQLTSSGQPVSLPAGNYRYQLADAISEPFTVGSYCDFVKIRIANDTPVGSLLYGYYGFEQVIYIPGEISGPSYDETETKTGDTRTAATVTKNFTVTIDHASEQVADALSLVSFHRLVEVSLLNSDGSAYRVIQAMEYEAKFKSTDDGEGGFNIELTLPVSVVNWNSGGSNTVGCVSETQGGELVPVTC